MASGPVGVDRGAQRVGRGVERLRPRRLDEAAALSNCGTGARSAEWTHSNA
jgi:hypothetical protein